MTASSEPESDLRIASVRQFTLATINSRLASEPGLLAAFWNQVATPADLARPDLTVFYCTVRWLGMTFALMEFVCGETLEDLVKGSDPASCEREIPVFCRLLDAFEGTVKNGGGDALASSGLELIDFGIGRATAPMPSKLHGSVLAGPGEVWSEEVFGEYGANRSQVRASLIELCARLPDQPPRSSANGPANLVECTVFSLAAPASSSKPEPVIAVPAAPVRRGLFARIGASPYLIAVATALLVLAVLYGVGGFLVKHSKRPGTGERILPSVAPPQVDAPPRAAAPRVTPNSSSARPSRRSRRQPVTSIVLTRGARPIRQTNLVYPDEAKREHVTGVVQMRFTVAEDGSVQSPRVLSGDPLLRSGLAEEVSQWVYQPLRINGQPVPMTTELAIKFNLNP